MPCSQGSPLAFQPDATMTDWGHIHPYTAKRLYAPAHPDGLKKLVQAVIDGEAAGGKLKAIGSNYSLSKAQVSDDFVIATHGLDRHLSQPHPVVMKDSVAQLIAGARMASQAHAVNLLQTIMHEGATLAPGKHLVHVEAGITIKQLLADLASVNLAIPTMGAGGGQTLAGAISTGTHGSDVNLPPLFDFVRALHIVGPGGQEWWLEPAAGVVGGPKLAQLPGWCPSTYVVRDDEWFRAALVTVGRFGVVYSMVLEVEEQYRLEETTSDGGEPWADVKKKLQASIAGDYFAGGVLDAPHGSEPLRFYAVVIDLTAGETCWVTRRWKTQVGSNVALDSEIGIDAVLCASGLIGTVLAAVVAPIPLLVAQVVGVPIVGLVWATALEALRIELISMAADSVTIGDFLVQVFARIGQMGEGTYGFAATELKAIVKSLGEVFLDGAQVSERRGPSHKILDTHDYDRDGCSSGNSTELFFDARQGNYLSFVSDVLKTADDQGPVPGYVAIRFVRASQALLAMERYDLTVAVEVAVPRSLSVDNYPNFTQAVEALAKKHGGVPHWGQEHAMVAAGTEAIYGDSLEVWRWALAELEADRARSFSSGFSRSRGLEVVAAGGVDEQRAQRSGGVLASALVPLF